MKTVIVYSGAPGVGKTTYIRDRKLKTTKPELADNKLLFEKYKPYLKDQRKLTFDIQKELSDELIGLNIKHMIEDDVLDRTFLDGFALSLLQFEFYDKKLDYEKMFDYILDKSRQLSFPAILEYHILETTWENNKKRLIERNRDIDVNMDWYEYCNNNFTNKLIEVLYYFDIKWELIDNN